MTLFGILFVILIQLIIPIMLIFTIWKGVFHSKLDWIIQTLFIGMFITWIFLSGSWDWVGYFFRYVWLIALIIAIYPSWKKAKLLPFRIKTSKKQKVSMGVNIFILLLFSTYNVFIISSYTVNDKPIELSFPMENGTYYIGHGGSNVQMNYHSAYPPQKYALDITKLNKFGLRANGLYPKALEKYAIYGEQLYSPCNAEVLEARSDLPDHIPPNTDSENTTGNYVALVCEDEDPVIYIAHMQEDSLLVNEGDVIKDGQKIGLVGNSGNTTEPHLHIHAEIDGEGVPILFDGKFLVRNNLVK